ATHRPADHKDASHLSCNAIATAHPTAPPTLAVARPWPNPHSCARGTAQRVPLPAVSSLGGFRTPAAVRGGTFVTAGVRKPSQKPTPVLVRLGCDTGVYTRRKSGHKPDFDPRSSSIGA